MNNRLTQHEELEKSNGFFWPTEHVGYVVYDIDKNFGPDKSPAEDDLRD